MIPSRETTVVSHTEFPHNLLTNGSNPTLWSTKQIKQLAASCFPGVWKRDGGTAFTTSNPIRPSQGRVWCPMGQVSVCQVMMVTSTLWRQRFKTPSSQHCYRRCLPPVTYRFGMIYIDRVVCTSTGSSALDLLFSASTWEVSPQDRPERKEGASPRRRETPGSHHTCQKWLPW